jgi:adenylate cyclase
MPDTTTSKKPGRTRGWVLLISLLCLGVSAGLGVMLREQEWRSLDMRMRMCCRVPSFRGRVSTNLVLLAIDSRTQEWLGRYGQGKWLTREPYVKQLVRMQQQFRPTVMAYDILFQESLSARDVGMGADVDIVRGVARALDEFAGQPLKPVSMDVLQELGRISGIQGNEHFSQALAAIQASNTFQVVMGYNLRGGWIDPQEDRTPVIEFHEYDDKVSFVADMAIPPEDVRGAPVHDGPVPAVNVNLPARSFLDYSLLGFINGPRDDDSVVRRLPLVSTFAWRDPDGRQRTYVVPSFALATVLLHEGVRFPLTNGVVEVVYGSAVTIRPPSGRVRRIPIDGCGRVLLNFNVRPEDFPAVSFGAFVVDGDAATTGGLKMALDGRMALVGTTATSIDVGALPVGANQPLVYSHMVAINNIMTGAVLEPVDLAGRVILALLVFAGFTVVLLRERSSSLAVWVVAAMTGHVCLAFVALPIAGFAMPMVQPLTYLATAGFSVLTFRYVREERARRQVRRMFGCMVSSKVLTYMEEDPNRLSLAGRAAEATIMFTDITGFTALGARYPAADVVRLLNRYLEPATRCILDGDGYVDKYMGDGIMAVWGAPYPDARHAEKACRVALAHKAIVEEVNRQIEAEFGQRIHVRMGINSGMVVAGTIGSERKFQYTVIGDAVNVAARLEPVNKDFGVEVILGPETQRRVAGMFVTRELGRVKLRGRSEPVSIFELEGEVGRVPEARVRVIRRYEDALKAMYGRQWDVAQGILSEPLMVGDARSEFLLHLVERFRRAELPAEWRGEYVRAEKD